MLRALQVLNVLFVSASIFLKAIEKFLFNKLRIHDKQKNLIEMQLNLIRNMISKALIDNEISEAEFENIISQKTKRNETYIKFDELFPEKNVWNK